jgi:hypothetical protein
LIIVPLVVFVRLRRAKSAAKNSDLWFEPEGDHYIYHPFGRWGGAFLVSPATRNLIRAKLAVFVRVATALFLLVVTGPMLLLGVDQSLFLRERDILWPIRLGMIVLLLLASLVWRRVAIRPLYIGAPQAPRRISGKTVRAKQAAARSWLAVGLSLAVMSLLIIGLLYRAYAEHNALSAIYALPLAILVGLNLRVAVAKLGLRQAGGPASGDI